MQYGVHYAERERSMWIRSALKKLSEKATGRCHFSLVIPWNLKFGNSTSNRFDGPASQFIAAFWAHKLSPGFLLIKKFGS